MEKVGAPRGGRDLICSRRIISRVTDLGVMDSVGVVMIKYRDHTHLQRMRDLIEYWQMIINEHYRAIQEAKEYLRLLVEEYEKVANEEGE